MSFNAEKSGMRDATDGNYARWEKLVDSEDRFQKFMVAKELMFRAMAYAMSLPIDVHR